MMMEELGQSPVLRHQQHLINSNSNSVANKDKLVNHQQHESWSTIELTGSCKTSDKVPMSTLYNTDIEEEDYDLKVISCAVPVNREGLPLPLIIQDQGLARYHHFNSRISSVKAEGRCRLPTCSSVSPILHRSRIENRTPSYPPSVFYASKNENTSSTDDTPIIKAREFPWRWMLNIAGGLAFIAPLGYLSIKDGLVGICMSMTISLLALISLVFALAKMPSKKDRNEYTDIIGANHKILPALSTRNVDTILEENEPAGCQSISTK